MDPSSGTHGSHPYLHMSHLFSIPLHLGKICRKAHEILLGPKAARRIERSSGRDIDALGMREIWDGLERCWDEFEGVRRGGLASGDVDPMVDRVVSGWQVNTPCTLFETRSVANFLYSIDIHL
jgi:hypothetical protein